MLLWHIGGTIAVIRYVFRDERIDLRLLILGAVLPDLVDLPIGAIWFSAFRSVQLFGHTMLFAALAMVIVVFSTKRGRARKRWVPLAAGILIHLVLDLMWLDSATLWWPFLGHEFSDTGYETFRMLARNILGDWKIWLCEGVGGLYLGMLVSRAGLVSAESRRRFIETGRIDVPIGRR